MNRALLYTVTLLLTGVLACSSVNKNVENYPRVTAQQFDRTCESPEEVHQVPPFRFPIPAQVIRHKNCMGVEDMLAIAFPGEASEKNMTAVKLLMLMYLEHQDSEYTSELLKSDRMLTAEGTVISLVFYRLKKTVKENRE